MATGSLFSNIRLVPTTLIPGPAEEARFCLRARRDFPEEEFFLGELLFWADEASKLTTRFICFAVNVDVIWAAPIH